MDKEILLSIVVPVYNVEEYLRECLDSIFDDSVDENSYEVIAIEDGSTDSSPEILKSYAKHKNLRIITQENAGLSVVRNRGISVALGQYVMFVDSDDYLLPGAMATLLNLAQNNECDLIGFGHLWTGNPSWQSGVCSETKVGKQRHFVDGKTAFVEAGVISAWGKLCRTKFLVDNSLFFYPDMTYEDIEWSAKLFFRAGETIYYDVPFYVYRKRIGSITCEKGFFKKCLNMTRATNLLIQFRKEIKVNESNVKFLAKLDDLIKKHLQCVIEWTFRDVSRSERALMFQELENPLSHLNEESNRQIRRLYKLARWLPVRFVTKRFLRLRDLF